MPKSNGAVPRALRELAEHCGTNDDPKLLGRGLYASPTPRTASTRQKVKPAKPEESLDRR